MRQASRRAAVTVAALALPLLASCRLTPPDCFDDVEVGQEYVVTLIEPWTADGRFEFIESPGNVAISCGDVDTIGPGEIRLRVVERFQRRGYNGVSCESYIVEPTVPLGIDVVGPPARGPVATAGFFVSTVLPSDDGCAHRWWLSVSSLHLRHDVLGVPAVDGELPPVIVRRQMDILGTECSRSACSELWVAEVRVAE